MSDQYLAIQVIMMPRDTNPHGTIFGGLILSYIDQAGAIGGTREVIRAGGKPPFLVTVAINRVEFKQPVHVGDVVPLFGRGPFAWAGRQSTMQVNVEVDRGEDVLQVTEAEVVYVGVTGTYPHHRADAVTGDDVSAAATMSGTETSCRLVTTRSAPASFQIQLPEWCPTKRTATHFMPPAFAACTPAAASSTSQAL